MRLKLYELVYGDTLNYTDYLIDEVEIADVKLPTKKLTSVNYFNIEGEQLSVSFLMTDSLNIPLLLNRNSFTHYFSTDLLRLYGVVVDDGNNSLFEGMVKTAFDYDEGTMLVSKLTLLDGVYILNKYWLGDKDIPMKDPVYIDNFPDDGDNYGMEVSNVWDLPINTLFDYIKFGTIYIKGLRSKQINTKTALQMIVREKLFKQYTPFRLNYDSFDYGEKTVNFNDVEVATLEDLFIDFDLENDNQVVLGELGSEDYFSKYNISVFLQKDYYRNNPTPEEGDFIGEGCFLWFITYKSVFEREYYHLVEDLTISKFSIRYSDGSFTKVQEDSISSDKVMTAMEEYIGTGQEFLYANFLRGEIYEYDTIFRDNVSYTPESRELSYYYNNALEGFPTTINVPSYTGGLYSDVATLTVDLTADSKPVLYSSVNNFVYDTSDITLSKRRDSDVLKSLCILDNITPITDGHLIKFINKIPYEVSTPSAVINLYDHECRTKYVSSTINRFSTKDVEPMFNGYFLSIFYQELYSYLYDNYNVKKTFELFSTNSKISTLALGDTIQHNGNTYFVIEYSTTNNITTITTMGER